MNSEHSARILEHDVYAPPGVADGARVIVMLHGRGADRHDLAPLRAHLPQDSVFVVAQAPFPGAAWGYGGGWAWYRFIADDRPEPESFRESQQALGDFIRHLPRALPVRPGPLVLGGFSQGGTMSLAFALAHPGSVARAVNLSGFLADHPDVDAGAAADAGTRYFWGHGTMDPAIPFDLAVRGRAALRAAGADLESRDYEMGHAISPEELRDLTAWLETD